MTQLQPNADIQPTQPKKRPLWMQLLIFLGIEALFYLAFLGTQALIYHSSVTRWAENTFGMQYGMYAQEGILLLCATEICAWRMGLHRVVPFGAHEPRRWTILPVTLWYGGVQLLTTLLVRVLPRESIPVLTENLLVYPVIHNFLMLMCFAALAFMVYSLRRGNGRRVWQLLAAQLALVLLMGCVNVSNMQVQDRLLFGSIGQPDGPTAVITEPIVITSANMPDDMPEGMAELFASLSEDPNTIINFVTGTETDGESIGVFSPDRWNPGPSMQAYEEAMAPVNTLSNVLYCVQVLGMFFIMKKWLFRAPEPAPEEV